MHILVTRPEPDASDLKAQLEALGHTVTIEPLLNIELMPIEAAAVEGAQALIVTSRNALRALAESSARSAALKLPIFVVGQATAELARTSGFARIVEGAGSARDLVAHIAREIEPASGPLVHLAGETLAYDLAGALKGEAIAVREIVAYCARPTGALSVQTAQLIECGALDAVILMSPRTAAVFAQLVAAAGLSCRARGLSYLCLSQAVMHSLQSLGPVHTEIADKPNTAEMLSLVGRVVTPPPGV